MSKELMTRSSLPKIEFSPAWEELFDTLLTEFIKSRYLPASYKKKVREFNELDVRFFLPSIRELHERFTREREDLRGGAPYFTLPKYRSAYFLYFLPLQAAKFRAVFSLHPEAIRAALESPARTLVDVGAGPGTASFAFLAHALEAHPKSESLSWNLIWIDSNRQIMEDGRAFLEEWKKKEPRLKGVKVTFQVGAWWKEVSRLNRTPVSLSLFGNLLNEGAPAPEKLAEPLVSFFRGNGKGAGSLFVEPAASRSAQTLSVLRDLLLNAYENNTLPWGPCLHSGNCPLSRGRDWCHFSYPGKIPGQWNKRFSQSVTVGGTEREWIKFSYVWLPALDGPFPKERKGDQLVISDELPGKEWLICEPDKPKRLKGSNLRLERGGIISSSAKPKTSHPQKVRR